MNNSVVTEKNFRLFGIFNNKEKKCDIEGYSQRMIVLYMKENKSMQTLVLLIFNESVFLAVYYLQKDTKIKRLILY